MSNSASSELGIVRQDSYLTLHYRIELASGPAAGSVFADTFTGRPATLQLGNGQWAPGMEEKLLGHREDERFQLDITPEDAYGARNPDLLQRITREMLASNAAEGVEFVPGDMVEFAAPNGSRYSGVLKEIDDKTALFDFNHPLAGVALRLDVHILGIL
ncbi:peptidylprolyl isomerase [Alcaligenes faecalis]|uniref:Peptidyl-prolyl cis-trans isomerase n=2 Tax=Alcaligenes TaxID=507 RepID=A0ABY7MYJ7_ALCFA|nr:MULTISPECIES: FKBP-type peptidyl-prolyl cis-trans isomerase [Alcaligenes]MCC9162038.1 FKBP-type peptidyl-prolyl cis-trans isomerase [Alcaligenes sp. MMA]MCH4225178.1 FKBP-type peptidyl-prolyl cis-trans isomerase [Alcaligenes faecalis]MCX5593855.1 FKBP-type peptidyl-prolyl cis-trans isomerase [Alcaligenes faecalis]MDT0216019.1 FKBP-type peptidyl-prolyl cis-trans isomerase [Alcaligenes sp. AB3]UQN34969.1 FKBP-type peptidyl-prolyl cis-trans isomerase [Alcaligenes aquatilis]